MKSLFCLFLACLSAVPAAAQTPPVTCVLQGEVIDRPDSKRLLLNPNGADFSMRSTPIPIVDGKFEYTLQCDHEEAYTLAFEDEVLEQAFRVYLFFAENDTVRFTLYPDERYVETVISGGILNREYRSILDQHKQSFDATELMKKWYEMQNSGLLYTQEANDLRDIWQNSSDREEARKAIDRYDKLQKENKHLSAEGEIMNRKRIQYYQDMREWEVEYAANHVSIPAYFLLIQKTRRSFSGRGLDHTSAFDLYNKVYADAYPDHPYTQEFQTAILSRSHIRPGGKYIDFTAPDFEGNPVTLSSRIEGQVALIDLWASWCGPCRRLSMSMIPVYEKYKDQGFVIVGVAREQEAENAVLAAQRDGYPWLNLLEVGDAAGIWNLYGVGNGGGATFLVDRDGTILAVHPDAEEVERILQEKLQ